MGVEVGKQISLFRKHSGIQNILMIRCVQEKDKFFSDRKSFIYIRDYLVESIIPFIGTYFLYKKESIVKLDMYINLIFDRGCSSFS